MDNGFLAPIFDAGMPSLSPFETCILVLILVILLLTLLSVAGYFPVLLSITSYTPIVARIKARGVPFIESERVMELIQSNSVPDCISRLKNAGYLNGVSLECSQDQVEEELLASWYKETTLLRSEAPQDAWMFFDSYLFFQELGKVKRIIRLVDQGKGTMIRENPDIWPDGFTEDLAGKIANVETVRECVRVLQDTKFGSPLLNALSAYEKEKSLYYFDQALDCMGYDDLSKQASKVMTSLSSPYRKFFAILSDIQNVRVLLRSKHGGKDPGEVHVCLLPGGDELPLWRLAQLNEMMSVPDIVRQLSGTRFEQVLSPIIRNYPSVESMFLFDKALDRLELDTVSRLSMDYYHTGGPVLWYLIAKEFELRNIRIILSGLFEGFSSEMIISMLVIQGDGS